MGEGWAAAVAEGRRNVFGRKLLFFEPEGEHAAAAVTAGMSMSGLRSTNFSSGQGIAYMHESLYAAVGKRLTYVLNVAARAMTKRFSPAARRTPGKPHLRWVPPTPSISKTAPSIIPATSAT